MLNSCVCICVTAQERFPAGRISMLNTELSTELNQPTGACSLSYHFPLIPHYRLHSNHAPLGKHHFLIIIFDPHK